MNMLFTITAIFFFIWIIRNILFWETLWQVKEYRIDRMTVHFNETSQGKRIFLSPMLFIKLSALFFFGYTIFHQNLLVAFQIITAAIFALEAVRVIREIISHRLKRPVLTFKATVIIIVTLITTYVFFLFPVFEIFVWLLIIERIIPFVIFFLVLLFTIPTELYREIQTQKAVKTLETIRSSRDNNLLVIGVTGSYGKSSTKEYVSQILSRKFRVVNTQGTNNTLIGVVNTVLTSIKKSTEIFVVEMGAYKRGEIAQMCLLVKPNVGILTAVSDQHLSLFGSFNNIKQAKYELIESIPKNGLAVFNGNDETTYELYKITNKTKVLYESFDTIKDLTHVLRSAKGYINASILAYNVHVDKTSISFQVFLKGKVIHVTAPLLGAHNVENLLPAIYLANHLGMTDKEIKKAVSLLSPLPKTMVRYETKKRASLIDDTFNASPDAVLAALSYMKTYKGKKIFVLTPLIELGKQAKKEHERLAGEITKICDLLFLTNNNYSKIFKTVGKGKKKTCRILVADPDTIADYIRRHTQNEDVVVFEGKEAGIALNKLV